jgi:spectinomycin phosphotransferase
VLEPPDIGVAELLHRVRAAFGLPANEAAFLPIGNDSAAWAFRLSAGGEAWFLKVVGRPVDTASLEVPRYLAARGIPHMLVPIPTTAGGSYDPGEPFSLVVYPFVEGEPGGEIGLTTAQYTEWGRVMRRIHDEPIADELVSIMRHERFVPRDAERVPRIGTELASTEPEDRFGRSLVAFWREHRGEIDRIVERTDALGPLARMRGGDRVICHADIHAWNVLVESSGELVIVDWDETVLAPRERDLMFVDSRIGGLVNDGPAFFVGYGQVQIDPLVMAYYRFAWVVEELVDFAGRVLAIPALGDGTRADALGSLGCIFEPGDVVEAAFRADDELTAPP